MSDLMIYLIKVCLGLAVVVLPYIAFLRNDPNLVMKRLYLLAGMGATWVFPLISLRKPDILQMAAPVATTAPQPLEFTSQIVTTSYSVATPGIDWLKIAIIIYVSGILLIILRNLFLLNFWNRIWKESRDTDRQIAYSKTNQVFTLFNRIFMPGSLKNEQHSDSILLHERAHIRQLHFIDLLLAECNLLLTWFNPFSWLISRMIKENHEHLADREVLSKGVNSAHYRALLLNQTLGVSLFRLGNHLNHSLTKKRFAMMKKTVTSRKSMFKLFLLTPVILLLLGFFSGTKTENTQSPVKGKVIIASTGEAAPGASIIIKGTSVGTVSDINGEFKLEVEGDPEVVISFVGFGTQILKASEINKKEIALETETYTLHLDEVHMNITKDDNSSFIIRPTTENGKQPVFVVDGKKVDDITDMDPERIEKVEVIKGEDNELVKKYNAKDGLILITTKKEANNHQPEDKESGHKGDEIFYVVEEMPSYPGGETALATYIYSHLEYPPKAKEKGVTGEVSVQFTVKATGKVEDIKVVKSSNTEFDKPALALFKNMPDWKPGSQRGKPVSVQLIVPVKFSLPSE